MQTFGDRLKYWIKANYGTLKNFSNHTGIPVTSVSNYTTQNSFPNKTFFKILINEGCNVNWLITGQGEKYIEKNDDIAKSNKINYIKVKEELLKRISGQPLKIKFTEWIDLAYGSVDNFIETLNQDKLMFRAYLNGGIPFDDIFYKVIKNAGCEVKFLAMQSMKYELFNKTAAGKRLMEKFTQNEGYVQLADFRAYDTAFKKAINQVMEDMSAATYSILTKSAEESEEDEENHE